MTSSKSNSSGETSPRGVSRARLQVERPGACRSGRPPEAGSHSFFNPRCLGKLPYCRRFAAQRCDHVQDSPLARRGASVPALEESKSSKSPRTQFAKISQRDRGGMAAFPQTLAVELDEVRVTLAVSEERGACLRCPVDSPIARARTSALSSSSPAPGARQWAAARTGSA
jgi:hypothetical protein